jgi:hypothetical protein
MKRNLHITLWLTAFLVAISIPLSINAQCLCEGGVAPTAVKYSYVLDTTSASSSTISFPKFDGSIGLLTCVNFTDTLSLITTSNVNNTSPKPETYIFNLRVVNHFSGPGVSVSQVVQKTYGPTTLGRLDSAHSVSYGPDTLFKNNHHSTTSSDVAGFIGSTGNASFEYTVNGGLTSDQGGINYNYQIISKYWGSFGLTYYWCPNMVLSTNIKNFAAVKSNKNVNLTWLVGNDLTSNTYEIQVSKNGREFTAAGNTKAALASSGSPAKYSYQYNPNQFVAGQLYFRIKQTDANGKISYSTVKTVNMDTQGAASFTAYPNPIVNKVSLQFDANLTGNYRVDLTNQVGQLVFSKPMKLNNTNLIQFNLDRPASPGMYYIRVKDESSSQVFTSKIVMQR